MRACSSGKETYASASMALEALLEVHRKIRYQPGTGPQNFYRCTLCDAWHLSSKGIMHPELKSFLAGKGSPLSNETARWEKKWKGR